MPDLIFTLKCVEIAIIIWKSVLKGAISTKNRVVKTMTHDLILKNVGKHGNNHNHTKNNILFILPYGTFFNLELPRQPVAF